MSCPPRSTLWLLQHKVVTHPLVHILWLLSVRRFFAFFMNLAVLRSLIQAYFRMFLHRGPSNVFSPSGLVKVRAFPESET